MLIGQICGKIVVIGQISKVMQNSRASAEFALIVAIATSQLSLERLISCTLPQRNITIDAKGVLKEL